MLVRLWIISSLGKNVAKSDEVLIKPIDIVPMAGIHDWQKGIPIDLDSAHIAIKYAIVRDCQH